MKKQNWFDELMKHYGKCYNCFHFPVCLDSIFPEKRKNCKNFVDKRKVKITEEETEETTKAFKEAEWEIY